MNEKIKGMLKKHIDINFLLHEDYHEDLNQAIIDICEAQKKECAEKVHLVSIAIVNTKNIAL